jgi:hypothetical protein
MRGEFVEMVERLRGDWRAKATMEACGGVAGRGQR